MNLMDLEQKYYKKHYDNYEILVSAVDKLEYTSMKDQYGNGYYHYLAWLGSYDDLINEMKYKNLVRYVGYIKTILSDNIFNNDQETTVWHYLARSGNYDNLIRALDEKRFDISIKNKYSIGILHFLAYSGNYDSIIKAINDKRFDISVKDKFGDTIWHYLARSGNYDSLIKAIDNKLFNPEITNNYGNTVWHYLALSGNVNGLIKAIIQQKFDINIINLFNETIWNYLIDASVHEDFIEEINKTIINKSLKESIINIIPKNYHYLLKNEIEVIWDSLSEDIQEKIMEEYPDFICPISKELLIDPVVNYYGYLYSRKNIEKWYLTHNTDPKTNQKVENKNLLPVFYISNKIKDILLKYQN